MRQNAKSSSPMRILIPLVAGLTLVGCQTLPSAQKTHSEYAALGDPQASLTYNTTFPVASPQEAILKGDSALAKGDLGRALFEYIRALEKGGPDSDLLYKVGQIHLARNDNRRAEVAFILALKESPAHAGGLTEMGRLRMRERDFDAARGFLTRAQEAAPSSAPIQNILGVLEDVQKNHEQAQKHYEKAIAINPREPRFLNNLGYSHYLSGNLKLAQKTFEVALQMDPSFERAWRNLALVYAKTERYVAALDAFGKIEEEYQAYNDVGFVAMMSGNYEQAERFFDEAIRLSPVYYELAERNAKRLATLKSQR